MVPPAWLKTVPFDLSAGGYRVKFDYGVTELFDITPQLNNERRLKTNYQSHQKNKENKNIISKKDGFRRLLYYSLPITHYSFIRYRLYFSRIHALKDSGKKHHEYKINNDH